MSGDITRGYGSSRVLSTKICTAEVDVSTSTVLTTITGCQHKLLGGMTYEFEAHITGTSGGSGGAKFAVAGDGQLTTSQYTCTAANYNATTLNAQTTVTTLGSAVGASTAVFTDCYITGSIVVTKPGVLNLQIAQNVSNGTATSALVGSTFKIIPVH